MDPKVGAALVAAVGSAVASAVGFALGRMAARHRQRVAIEIRRAVEQIDNAEVWQAIEMNSERIIKLEQSAHESATIRSGEKSD